MNIKKTTVIFIFLVPAFLVTAPDNLLAQSAEGIKKKPFDPQISGLAWQESISGLRESAQILINENDKLNTESNSLFTIIADTQKAIEEAKAENERLLGEPPRLNGLIEEANGKIKSLEKDNKEFENRILSSDKELVALQKKLSNLEQKLEPWEEQITGLNAQKTELEVALKLKEAQPKEDQEKWAGELQGLKGLLTQNETAQENIQSEIAGLKQQLAEPSNDVQYIRKENRNISIEISKTKDAQKSMVREVEALKRKNTGAGTTDQKALDKQAQQKEGLLSKANELEAQVAQLEQAQPPAPPSADVAEAEIGDLRKTLEGLEQEHQGLENRIFDLNEAIAVLKKDNAMIEALLNSKNAEATPSEIKKASPEEPMTVDEAMGYAYASQGMYEDAIRHYEEALKQVKNRENIYFNLGYSYFKMGNIGEAIKNYKQVLRIDPKDYEARRNLAELNEKYSPRR